VEEEKEGTEVIKPKIIKHEESLSKVLSSTPSSQPS